MTNTNNTLSMDPQSLAPKEGLEPITEVAVLSTKDGWIAAVQEGVFQLNSPLSSETVAIVNTYSPDAHKNIKAAASRDPEGLTLIGSRTSRKAIVEEVLSRGQLIAGPEEAQKFFAVAEQRRATSQVRREAYFERQDSKRVKAIAALVEAGVLTKDEAVKAILA